MVIEIQKGAHIIQALRNARKAAGVSQSALSQLAGFAQGHVSNIENGTKEPTLSKVIDMARALDLELVLVPRKMLPAVESLIHPADLERRSPAYAIQVLDRAESQIKKQQVFYGPNAHLDRMWEALRFLRRAPLKPELIEQIKQDTEALRKRQASAQSSEFLKELSARWTMIRNRLAHAVEEAPRPAFALSDEDDNA